MTKIRLGVAGYGNIAKGCIAAARENPDTIVAAVFTRRDPQSIKAGAAAVDSMDNIAAYKEKIDVLLLCMGSATDVPEWGPRLARDFCVVDSYDNHAQLPRYLREVDAAARAGGTTAVCGTGWDPGFFSLQRVLMESAVPKGKTHTFWGKGVSQGHSEAVRGVKGVKKGIQYTIPIERTLEAARAGGADSLLPRQTHQRQCFVVAEKGADTARIEKDIKTMPDYFEPYNTQVIFIDEEKFDAQHNKMPHGGFVIRSALTGGKNAAVQEYSLKLESNPEFTGCVMTAYARAAYRLRKQGVSGALTVFDVPPALLSPRTREELIAGML